MGFVIQHELIGKHISVVEATNPSLVGLNGEIIDETKQLLVISTPQGEKKLLKKHITILIKVDGKPYIVKGLALVGRSEERLKK